MEPFDISPPGTTQELAARRATELVFTLSNRDDEARAARMRVAVEGALPSDWLELEGEEERRLAPRGAERVVVRIAPSATGSAVEGTVRLEVWDPDDPDRTHQRSPSVRVTVPEAVPTRPPWLWIGLAAAVVVAAGVAFLLWPRGVPVPAVAGTVPEIAEDRLDQACRGDDPCFVVTREVRSDEVVDEGVVIGTEPAEGQRVAAGSEVRLVVSGGPERVAVPDLEGLTPEAGVIELFRSGLEPDITASDVWSDSVAVGRIAYTDPRATSEVAPGSGVALRISKGPCVRVASPVAPAAPNVAAEAVGVLAAPRGDIALSAIPESARVLPNNASIDRFREAWRDDLVFFPCADLTTVQLQAFADTQLDERIAVLEGSSAEARLDLSRLIEAIGR